MPPIRTSRRYELGLLRSEARPYVVLRLLLASTAGIACQSSRRRVARRWRRRRPILAPRHASPMLCSPMRLPATPLSNVPRAILRELGADSGVGGEGRPIRRQRARSTQHLCCAHLCACLHHLSVTCRVRSIGSSGPVVSSAGRRAPVPGGLIKSHRACADRQGTGLAYPNLPGFSLC